MNATKALRYAASLAVTVILTLTGCSSTGTETAGSGHPAGGGSAGGGGATATASATGKQVTVTGALGAKRLAKGVCSWVETNQGRVEFWVTDSLGQVLVFTSDYVFEGIYSTDPNTSQAAELLFRAGERVTVTGTTYESTPECGSYGVHASKPVVRAGPTG